MKKEIFVLCLAFTLVSKIFSQGWIAQTSGTTEILYSVHFINDLTGWTAGSNGIIRATTNGGINWTAQISGIPVPFYEIFFANSQTGWICGGNGGMIKTKKGG